MILVFNLGLFLIAVLVSLEVTDRFIEKQKGVALVYDFHALRRQTLLPNQEYQSNDVRFSINEHGMRGCAPDVPKPPGVCRVVVMGGSAVFDHLLSEGESWPERIGASLSEADLGQVESFNAGVPGFGTRETLAYYHDKIRFFEPDLVLLYQGWNDVKYMVPFEHQVDVDSFYYVTPFWDFNKWFTASRPLRNWYAL